MHLTGHACKPMVLAIVATTDAEPATIDANRQLIYLIGMVKCVSLIALFLKKKRKSFQCCSRFVLFFFSSFLCLLFSKFSVEHRKKCETDAEFWFSFTFIVFLHFFIRLALQEKEQERIFFFVILFATEPFLLRLTLPQSKTDL